MSQHKDVLAHLEQIGSLTQLEALSLYGVGRLAAVVFDLKKDGHDIATDMIDVTKADGSTAHVASYRLVRRAGDVA